MNRLNQKELNSIIPQFALYGELVLKQDPEFVHIEDIYERSSKNGWVIKPHRHTYLFQVLCVYNGEIELQLDDSNLSLKGSCAITIPTGIVHGFRFHPDTEGIVLSLATNYFSIGTENRVESILEDMMSQPRIIRFQENSWLQQHLIRYFELIRSELTHPHQGQQFVLYSLVKIALITLRRQVEHDLLSKSAYEPGNQLISQFRTLLEKNYKHHWKICEYADALHVSVSTLNRVCHEALGTSAKKLIQDRLLIEAKRRLIYTRQTLDQIADSLGFKDPAYFSRVFKKMEGLSPRDYRQSHYN